MRRFIIALLALTLMAPATPTHAWSSSQQCTKYEAMLHRYEPTTGWNVDRMSYYMWRESRCLPWVVSSTSDSGLLQVNRVNRQYLAMRFHLPTAEWWFVREWLKNPVNNIMAASVLSKFAARAWGDRYQPWRT